MKRLITLFLAAGLFATSMAPQAQAVQVQMDGKVIISAQDSQGLDFVNSEYRQTHTGMALEDYGFGVRQRFQVGMKFIVSESVSATLVLRAPNNAVWGSAKDDFALGGSSSVKAKYAYLDWIVPNTDISVRMGVQNFAFPLSFGWSNPVMDDSAAGITVFAPINDNFGIIAQWFRPETTPNLSKSTLDVFAIQMPIMYDNFSITPWGAFAIGGRNATSIQMAPGLSHAAYKNNYNAFWLGFSSVMNFNMPLELGLDAIYGSVNGSAIEGTPKYATKNSGWMVDGYLAYATDYGTPALFGWYASGDDRRDNNKRGGQLPQISAGYGFGNSLFFDNSVHGIMPSTEVYTPAGTWGAGLKFTGFIPMERVEMGAHVMYAQGTNSKYNAGGTFTPSYLTTKDSFVELGMYTTYDLYRDLELAFEANYIIQNFDKEIWNINRLAGEDFVNAWRAGISFMYSF